MRTFWGNLAYWQRAAIALVALLAVFVVEDVVFGDPAPSADGSSFPMAILWITLGVSLLVGVVLLVIGWRVAMNGADEMIAGAQARANEGFALPRQRGSTITHPDAADIHGSDVVAVLERLGFERAGSYDFDLTDHVVTYSCLVSPDQTTIAAVGPLSYDLISDFDGKLLTTSPQPSPIALPEHVLAQWPPEATPESVWVTHRSALARLGRIGFRPEVVGVDDAVQRAIDVEHASVSDADPKMLAKAALSMALNPFRGDEDPVAVTDADISAWRNSSTSWTDALAAAQPAS